MIRSISSRKGKNLPGDASRIVGRRREASEIRRLMDTASLLTLTGPGGVGKTRLALHVAANVRRAFPDGVHLVELAALWERELLAGAVAEALGVYGETSRSTTDTLVDHLRGKRILIVLDNCEHLVDACAALTGTLLNAAPEVRIIATSREPLGLRNEVLFTVPPMSVPEDDIEMARIAPHRYEALTLFAERAKVISPDFDLEAQYALVGRLCRLLDGIPLAIELAAVWLRVLSLDQIISRLDDRFHFLTQGYRNVLPRHQTLRAAIDWSYDLCSSQERLLWERLTVFSGDLDLDEAESVCSGGPLDRGEILHLMANLLGKSILIRDDSGVRTRYRMLETIRQYGEEWLVKSGSQDVFRRAHLGYYQRLAEKVEPRWFSSLQTECAAEVVLEMPNFRAAMDFCFSNPALTGRGIRITIALYGYWVFFGGLSEARHWLARALSREGEDSRTRFKLLAAEALFALMQGRVDAASPLFERCFALSGRWEDEGPQMMTKFLSGRIALLRGDYPAAVEQLEEVCDWRQRNADRCGKDDILHNSFLPAFYLAIAAVFLEDPRAGAFTTRCREMAEEAGAQGEISMGQWITGVERWRAGDAETAGEWLLSSLRIERSNGYLYTPSWGLEALAWTTAAQGRGERAACLLGAAAMIRELLELSLSGFHAYAEAHDVCASSLRESLGEEVYRSAFARGRGLDFDQAIGYALQDVAPAADAVPSDTPDDPMLSPRELQVAELIAGGARNKEIAARLVISHRTAEGHVERILSKLGFTSRAQIASWYVKNVSPPSEAETEGDEPGS
ncbi:LuxR C-terminal-related transcriptional regulator [Streptosporangium sp. NPDC048047]|uniref:ATP-binding protein n=1 Tax=Streptosporangium sp. NPDC048047 TaxID=3155748 RepID=UPI00341D03A7